LTSIIVLFPKIENAKNIRNILVKSGFSVEAVCNTGAQALQYAQELNDGVVVCGYKYPDMICTELSGYLPDHFQMLLVASRPNLAEVFGSDIVCVEMPLKVHELVSTVSMMVQNLEQKRRKRRQNPVRRSEQEQGIIDEAKALLMERNNMTESEAHRYIQKSSMDSGTGLSETAQMILALMG